MNSKKKQSKTKHDFFICCIYSYIIECNDMPLEMTRYWSSPYKRVRTCKFSPLIGWCFGSRRASHGPRWFWASTEGKRQGCLFVPQTWSLCLLYDWTLSESRYPSYPAHGIPRRRKMDQEWQLLKTRKCLMQHSRLTSIYLIYVLMMDLIEQTSLP